ncbi:MAG: hypothetical protein MI920_21115 [Kiloniellales bacterium]|nr:hypothetical protein [Kiloniellales bacterium]
MVEVKPPNWIDLFDHYCVLERLVVVVDNLDEASKEHLLEPLDLIFQYLELASWTECQLRAGMRRSFLALQSDLSRIGEFKLVARAYVSVARARLLGGDGQVTGANAPPDTTSWEDAARKDQQAQLMRDILEITGGPAVRTGDLLSSRRSAEAPGHGAVGLSGARAVDSMMEGDV